MSVIEAINIIETMLRDLIRDVIGDDWRIALDPSRAEGMRKKEIRPAVVTSDDALDFTEFSHLHSIITGRWADFGPVLGDEDEFKLLYGVLLWRFRNAAMHSRALVPFEEHLVLGITGMYRNRITLYRSTKGPDMQYYPKISRVADSFGNELTAPSVGEPVVLKPGDIVEFLCAGTDPQDRDIHWDLVTLSRGGAEVTVDSARGSEVRLTWHVSQHEVRESHQGLIRITGEGEFHRHGDYDDKVWLSRYAVRPPD